MRLYKRVGCSKYSWTGTALTPSGVFFEPHVALLQECCMFVTILVLMQRLAREKSEKKLFEVYGSEREGIKCVEAGQYEI